MRDQVDPTVARALIDYLQEIYGNELPSGFPVWVSFSRNDSYGEAIGTQAISAVCEKYLNISKVHATRHSFAILMEEAGARLSDIGERLGHSNLATTSRYMTRLHSAENAYAEKIAMTLGIGE
jgi:integrase/recombinase XerD